MHFIIETFEDNPNRVNVKNQSDRVYQYDWTNPPVKIAPNEQLILDTDVAKHVFGNWTDDSFKEKKRQREMGIDIFELTIQTIKSSPKNEQNHVNFDVSTNEQEFLSIDEPKDHCEAITKSGKVCKNDPVDGGTLCKIHQVR